MNGPALVLQKKDFRSRSTSEVLFSFAKATAGFEPAIGVLQTPALPLGYVARSRAILAQPPGLVKPYVPLITKRCVLGSGGQRG